MKYLMPFILTIALTACSGGSNNSQTDIQTTEEVNQISPASTDKFEFIDTKTEQVGDNANTMELYSPIGQLDLDALKSLCADRKNNFTSGTFFFVVIFDSKVNSAFPSDPFTAEYGMEENKMKHIKALYTFNSKNGYSKLATYKDNMYESAAVVIPI